MQKGGCVYIMCNTHHTTLYIGVTSNLRNRVHQHKTKFYPQSFTARYNLHKLVYYESLPGIVEAITREKQMKKYSRKKKEALIHAMNPKWEDLWEVIRMW